MRNYFSFALFVPSILLVFSLGVLLNSCIVCSEPIEEGASVDFYLLEPFDTLEASFKINKESVVLESKSFIEYSELLSYNKSDYTFELSESAVNMLKSKRYSVRGLGFAVTANDEVIYTGYFWPSFSSMSCDWITTDPFLLMDGNKMKINIGYPNSGFAQGVPDDRNDQRILDIFKASGKLKK